MTRRNLGPALSIPAAAVVLGWPEQTLRRACDRGEVRISWINGLRRIGPGEIERLKKLFGSADTLQDAGDEYAMAVMQ
jgi:hypothetical protein